MLVHKARVWGWPLTDHRGKCGGGVVPQSKIGVLFANEGKDAWQVKATEFYHLTCRN